MSLRTVLAVMASFVSMAICQTLQAQATPLPIFFCGVVGDTGSLLTTQGDRFVFGEWRPNPAVKWNGFVGTGIESGLSKGKESGEISLSLSLDTPISAPTYLVRTIELFNDMEIASTGEIHAIIFSTSVHRDAFLYYVQQREAAATQLEYDYFSTLGAYEFWIGQENEGLALYSYYTGMASYLRDTASEPKQGKYSFYYYTGLGAYYYFAGIGDQASADLAFAYHYQLAVEALGGS